MTENTKSSSSNKLLIGILLGIIAGFLIGGVFPKMGLEIQFLGDLFIKALLMLVVPLIVASMVVGISRLGDVRRIGSLGTKAISYYMLTTAISVFIGIVMVNIVKPGYVDDPSQRVSFRGGQILSGEIYTISKNVVTLEDSIFQSEYGPTFQVFLSDQGKISGIVTESISETKIKVNEWLDENKNPVTPEAEGAGLIVDLAIAEKVKGKKSSIKAVLIDMVEGLIPKNLFKAMANNDILPLIVFSLLFGGVLTTLGEKGKPVIALFEGINEAVMKIIHLIMLFAPIGIGALIAGRMGKAGGIEGFGPELARVGKYALTVIGGLLIHAIVVLPLILAFLGKRKIFPYLYNVLPALTTGFSTASSSATLPMTMECTTEKNKISNKISSFILPLGATINMDGTAMYEAVAAIFIAQAYGIDLGSVQMLVIFIAATIAGIGAAGIPEAGLVTMVIVLKAVDLPIEGISLILVIDWFLDRCRTTINIWGDVVGAAVVDRLESRSLKILQPKS